MKRACEQCGSPVSMLTHGRTPRFCGATCRKAANREKHSREQAEREPIPAELRERDRWVTHTETKRPTQVDGSSASSTNPATWTSYSQVRTLERRGFVLGDGIGCIDLDHAILPTGEFADWAQEIVDANAGTFMEISRSGTGVHIFGLLAEGPGRKIRDGERNIEIYSRGRYIAITGRTFPGSISTLADLSEVGI